MSPQRMLIGALRSSPIAVTNPNSRQRRLAQLRERLANPQDAYEICRAYPCSNRTTADSGEGLNRLYCRKHIEFYRRHGSYYKTSYRASELKPHRNKAEAWLGKNIGRADVSFAVRAVRALYGSAGAPVDAFRLTGKSPHERARVIWAQLRAKAIDPVTVVAVWQAVGMKLADDLQPDLRVEYRQVQAAKLIHRLAGGTHRRWEREGTDGRAVVTELHRHPVSRGRVLRVVGSQLAAACAGLTNVVPPETE